MYALMPGSARRPAAPARVLASAALVAAGMLVPLLAETFAGPAGDCAGVPGAQRLRRTELYFGLSRPDGGAVDEAEFQRFVASDVAPELPGGFTVMPGSGHFRASNGRTVHEPSRVLLVLHPPGSGVHDAAIERIRARYRAAYLQESVLRVDGQSCASF